MDGTSLVWFSRFLMIVPPTDGVEVEGISRLWTIASGFGGTTLLFAVWMAQQSLFSFFQPVTVCRDVDGEAEFLSVLVTVQQLLFEVVHPCLESPLARQAKKRW